MRIAFRRSFEKDLKSLKDASLLRRVKELIEAVEAAHSLSEITGLKKLRGSGNYYRLRIGDFRVGMAIKGEKFTFVRFIHRKDIYKFFP